MERKQVAKVKITILKTLYHEDLIDEYLLPEKKKDFGPCYRFSEGEEYIIDSFEMPKGFCPWAWADLHKSILPIMFNGDIPVSKKPGIIIASCTDGLRPVIFKIERIDD